MKLKANKTSIKGSKKKTLKIQKIKTEMKKQNI
jgi:hypothetical protein